MKPRLLDLFCKAGGCTKGYQNAGFYVVGVDIEPQPRYCGDAFILGDALDVMRRLLNGEGVSDTTGHAWHLTDFDAFGASPPCQGYSDLKHRTGKDYPMLIDDVRRLLQLTGKPYVIENVEGAPLDGIMLCGTMFGLRVIRHRLFESSILIPQPHHVKRHPLVYTHDKRKAHYGKLDESTAFVQVTGGGNCSVATARAAMGIDWMTKDELNEAIPPAYTEYIGNYLLGVIQHASGLGPIQAPH